MKACDNQQRQKDNNSNLCINSQHDDERNDGKDTKRNGEKQLADKVQRLEHIIIPDSINYDTFNSISTEAKQKLKKIKPKTLGQAKRISGVSPADISIILIHLRG